jgi:hypothetical protein
MLVVGSVRRAATIHFVNLYHVYGYYYLFSSEDGHFYPDFIMGALLRVDRRRRYPGH